MGTFMVLNQITPPSYLPLSLSEAKNDLKISTNADDDRIQRIMRTSIDTIETFTGKRLITQTWDYYFDYFCDEIKVPYPPLQSITYIKYKDTSGAWQTLSTSVYDVDTFSVPGKVYRAYNATWPSIQEVQNAINIRFIAGYGSVSDIPERFIDAILLDMKMQMNSVDPAYMQTLMDRRDALILKDRIIWL